MRSRSRWLAILFASLLAPAARAATIVVTTTADPAPTGCGLRDALAAAEADAPAGGCPAGSGADVIDLTTLEGVIHLGVGTPTALPPLATGMTLVGPGADRLALSGDGTVRVLAIYSFLEQVAIEGLTIRDGTSADGAVDPGLGGCLLAYGSLVLRDARITGCTGWGALYVAMGTTRLQRVLVDANQGQGIAVGGSAGAGAIVIESSTISGNGSTGLELVNADGPGPNARIYASTFADNGTANLYVPIYSGDPLDFPMRLDHVVLANQAPAVNCSGQPVISELANLADDTSCNLDAPGDLVDVDPALGPLADNGGPTATHALLAGSPALDSGESACPGYDSDLLLDQRGSTRPWDGDGDGQTRCDRGAFEVPEPGSGAGAAALLALAARARRRRAMSS